MTPGRGERQSSQRQNNFAELCDDGPELPAQQEEVQGRKPKWLNDLPEPGGYCPE